MNSDVLDEIEKIGFDNLFKMLLAYSDCFLKRINQKHELIKQPADIAAEVIEIALTKSVWDKSIHPTIQEHIKHLCKNAIRRVTRNEDYKTRDRTDFLSSEKVTIRADDPGDIMDAQNLEDEMRELVKEVKKNINDPILDVFEAMLLQYTNIEIAELLSSSENNIEVSIVENCKKRIKRSLKPLRNE